MGFSWGSLNLLDCSLFGSLVAREKGVFTMSEREVLVLGSSGDDFYQAPDLGPVAQAHTEQLYSGVVDGVISMPKLRGAVSISSSMLKKKINEKLLMQCPT